MLDDRLVAPPGTSFSYTSTGYAMLAAVIERVTGLPFASAMDQSLFEPLGLSDRSLLATLPGLATGYNIGQGGPTPGPEVPAGFLSGGSGICSTAGDLVRWERSLVDGTAIGRDAFRDMSSSSLLDDGTPVPYGLGFHLDELGHREAVFHEGGTVSFSSWLAYYPDQDLIVVVLSNTFGPHASRIQDLVVELTDAAVDN